MKYFYFLIFLIIVVSCKKDKNLPAKNTPIKTIETIEQNNIVLTIDSLEINTLQDSLVQLFYSKNNYQTFWLSKNKRDQIVTLLKNIENEGFFIKDFSIKKIVNYENNFNNLKEDELKNYDLLLTQNCIKFIKLTSTGKLNPKKIFTNWDLKPNKINYTELLLNFQKKDSFNFAYQQVIPNHKTYKSLKKALLLLKNLPEENYEFIEASDKIVLNDTNTQIPKIKRKLMYWGDLHNMDSISPIYDTITEKAIKKFQIRHGLAPDGVVGKGTVLALNHSKQRRIKQVIANLERWRWYPRSFESNYLLINIPDYNLQVIKNSDTLFTHKVIVGKYARQTPILSSKLSHLVLNPTWTVPPTILKNDVIPAATKNRYYLTNKNLSTYLNGQLVPVEAWNPLIASKYRYVQSPGKHNSLGLIKFMFKNRFMVYLHDTNTRSYFSRENRSLSSGCVRVQNPFELAVNLLDQPEEYSLDKINEIVKKGETKTIYLKTNVYVHLFYWTAWSENNTLQFRDDLYGLDMPLFEKITSN